MTRRLVKEKRVTVRFSQKIWDALNKLAKDNDLSMSFIINEGVKKLLKDKKISLEE